MLVTLDNTKNYLGIPLVDTSFDAFLTEQITLVSDAIEQYCARKFSQATYVEYFYKDELVEQNVEIRHFIPLYVFPVISITEIKEFIDEEDIAGQAITAYRLNKPSGILRRTLASNQRFLESNKILKITYVAGFATIPALITSTTYSIVEERYNKKKSGINLNFGSDVQRVSIPGVISVDYDYSLQNNERKSALGQIIGNYANVLDVYRTDRAVVNIERLSYVE